MSRWTFTLLLLTACGDLVVVEDDDTPPPPTPPSVCGDGVIGPGEPCDDGNTNDADFCTTSCGVNQPNDGICNELAPDQDGVDCECVGEPCEPRPELVCGNGIVEDGEDCDEWVEGETKQNTATCDVDCTAPDCNDTIQNNAANECCADSGEFRCPDRELLAKKEAGDPLWCLCIRGEGGAGGGG